jgi:aspartyl-tRNA(Asn)/glutamyl-tRNA(Gln) amidotransferase subunit B
MRSKESANDYRYFPEPDLQPVIVTNEYIESVRKNLPPLPNELHKKYVDELKLGEYDANVLTELKEVALYFNELITYTKNYKAAANWVMVNVKSVMNEKALHIDDFPVKPKAIADIIALIDAGKVGHTAASQKLFPALIANPTKSAEALATELDIIQNSNSNEIQILVEQAVNKFPEKIAEYRNGKVGLLGLFVGEVMKLSKGKADPKVVNELVKEQLEKN